ncbi:PLP-dependent aminotransferase family protein [Rhodoferax sp.]|uniref:aminotransferase-like domain-containing protein n=1 Tax=Rhodoferax sp. TaxID=50421 RepID=UPI00374CB79D
MKQVPRLVAMPEMFDFLTAQLDRGAATPLFMQIADSLQKAITARDIPASQTLPSIRVLAAQLGVSAYTVSSAYAHLVAQGLLSARHGSGVQVAARSIRPEQIVRSASQTPTYDWPWLLGEKQRQGSGMLELSGSALPADWGEARLVSKALKTICSRSAALADAPAEPYGYAPLRTLVQQRLARLHVDCALDQIVITSGATAALSLIINTLVQPGQYVLLDEPTYFGLHVMLRIRGARVVAVSRLPTGPDFAALQSAVQTYRPVLYFTQTALHGPTGTSYSSGDVARLAGFARDHALQLVEGDYYVDLDENPRARISAFDQLASSIYVGACAKSITGPARIGYLACAHPLAREISALKLVSGLANFQFQERVATQALGDPECARNLRSIRQKLDQARGATLAALHQHGLSCFGPPTGGKYAWVRHPDFPDATQLAESAYAAGLVVAPGKVFSPGDRPVPWFRLNVALGTHPRWLEWMKHHAPKVATD